MVSTYLSGNKAMRVMEIKSEKGRELIMTEDVIKEEQANSKKVSWEAFVKQDALNFMMAHNLQAITIDDGGGKKGVIKRTSKGDFSVQITSNEIL
ncbi:hypothetical protein SpAn4DRAFT_0310 [Sporomusa ovata]|uniref:Uncharacterized protein n=2 Tax=Sporomusa ovata TaxID=2378 RepID=A0A0U1L2G7_9FIRM|nr:hypothetical protein SpAn4DRAFT_0310 [Sporomusa ovata]